MAKGGKIVKKSALATMTLALAVGLSGAMLTTQAQAQAKPKAAKAPNHEAMMKSCQDATKNLYTGDQRVFTYGYCVSKLPHAGTQQQQIARR
jgi:invasion protein IalB